MTLFRPCIDLHQGKVKQIVGGTLDESERPKENFVSDRPAAYFAELYQKDGLCGGHMIQLGPGNQEAAAEALRAAPGTLQLGGGITPENARPWLSTGASQVIVTSYLFDGPRFAPDRLRTLLEVVSPTELVIDLSCRKVGDRFFVAKDRWQVITEAELDGALMAQLAKSCSEFLIHAADVEGLCRGIDEGLVKDLGRWSPLPCTYAGGGRSLADLELVEELSGGRVDLTIGSALDLFGGSGVSYEQCLAFNRARS